MNAGCRRVSRAVLLTACSALVAGCGSGARPELPRTDAAKLIALAHRIASEGACGQARDIPRLQAEAISLVNRGRVPGALQETLMGAVGALGERVPVCLPTVTTVPAPEPSPPGRERHGHEHEHGHGKKKR